MASGDAGGKFEMITLGVKGLKLKKKYASPKKKKDQWTLMDDKC